MNDLDKFKSKIKISSIGCWEWQGCLNRDRYGITDLRSIAKTRLAHRISYIIHKGKFDESLKVLHRCDNPPCVNPAHLFLGTDADNVEDMVNKGRNFSIFKKGTHCKKGHLFTEGNTYVKPNGKRTCRTCTNQTKRIYNKQRRLKCKVATVAR